MSNPFSEPDSPTRVFCVVSGKGGVGKSSVTVNLAVAFARRGLRVGVLDADIHGHSIPDMLGCTDGPTRSAAAMTPPSAAGVRVMSVGMFAHDNAPIVWRGPMLHGALRQFLTDVDWGELDVLLVDQPPGTGDIAISLAQMLPTAQLLVVTTPQASAARVAERAGAAAARTEQRVAGVVENMSWYDGPDGVRRALFGEGGGAAVAGRLTELLGVDCPLLARIPFDPRVGEAADRGVPIVVGDADSSAAQAFHALAEALPNRRRELIGRRLAIAPTG
ncbi:Mrp/NBP35 family ATP-binding protein [Nocardia arizonensis]|uniref:Mrp/NBP35 family ATP-binding protein n=1 Tax=Nocardia arizonensis TaxID=1141647 RepID=UPI0006D1F67F|nr:Mrp/NBP35 family ATP-binding protein [Nocardia arizonensis]